MSATGGRLRLRRRDFCNSKFKVTFEEILASFKLDRNTGPARIGT